MRFPLRTLFLAPGLIAAASLTTNTAMAGTVTVPFSFTVAGKRCPAGVYSVERDKFGDLVTLQSRDGARTFNWVLSPGDAAPMNSGVALIFDETGQTHMLRSVHYGSLVTSRLDKMSNNLSAQAPTQIINGQ